MPVEFVMIGPSPDSSSPPLAKLAGRTSGRGATLGEGGAPSGIGKSRSKRGSDEQR